MEMETDSMDCLPIHSIPADVPPGVVVKTADSYEVKKTHLESNSQSRETRDNSSRISQSPKLELHSNAVKNLKNYPLLRPRSNKNSRTRLSQPSQQTMLHPDDVKNIMKNNPSLAEAYRHLEEGNMSLYPSLMSHLSVTDMDPENVFKAVN